MSSELSTEFEISNEAIDKYMASKGEYEIVEQEEVVQTPEVKEVKEPVVNTPSPEVLALKSELETLKSLIVSQNTKPEVKKEEVAINYDEMPLEYLKKQQEDLQAKINTLEIQKQERQKVEDIHNFFIASFKEYEKEFPQALDAVNHLVKSREDEYIALGFTKQEAEQLRLSDEFAILERCKAINKNPAKIYHDISKIRGFVLETKKAPKANTVDISVAKGKSEAKSLNSVGKSAVETTADTYEALAALEGDEFDKAFAKMAAKMRN